MVAVTSLLWVGFAGAAVIDPHVHEALYYWHVGGTNIEQSLPVDAEWTVGDPTGGAILKIEEDVWAPSDNQGGPEGAWLFEWHIDAFTAPADALKYDANGDIGGDQWITSFAVPAGASTLVQQYNNVGGANTWSFDSSGGVYSWMGAPQYAIDGNPSLFRVWVTMPEDISPVWAISTGQVDYNTERGAHTGLLYGAVSHPNDVPEPATLSLLALGLFGVGGLARRRRTG